MYVSNEARSSAVRVGLGGVSESISVKVHLGRLGHLRGPGGEGDR